MDWDFKNYLFESFFFLASLEKFENAAILQRLGLPSTLIRRNRPPKTVIFENNLQTAGILQRPLCVLV